MTAARLAVVAEALGASAPRGTSRVVEAITEAAGSPSHPVSYLVMSVLRGRIPMPDEVKAFTREWRSGGLAPLIRRENRRASARSRPVFVSGATVIDVTDTLASRFTTGIQRVARETVVRWVEHPDREVVLVRWNAAVGAFLALDQAEVERVAPGLGVPGWEPGAIVVPYRGRLFLPEISVDPGRVNRLRTVARHAGGSSLAIAFDCIPVTTAETAAAGMPGAFSKYLSTLARFDAVAPISEAAATEYRGWKRMLAGAGLVGPEITTVELPFTSAGSSDPARASRLRQELGLGDDPIVLCVGSHEPRKNHLAVLHAAERAWRSGSRFSLVLVGGNSWETERFDRLIAYLRRRDRRVVTLSGVDDDVIWGLYELASFSLFPSLNEGFGLPVVESIAHGTPVITSDFGSMRALGEDRGGRLVDPRDVSDIADGIRELLGDETALAALRAQTGQAPESDWTAYADRLWRLAESSAH